LYNSARSLIGVAYISDAGTPVYQAVRIKAAIAERADASTNLTSCLSSGLLRPA
jgi:hypothetical protein